MINLFMLAKAYELDINFCIGLLTYPKIQHTCVIASILNFLIKSKESEFIANPVITQQKRERFYFHGVAQWGIDNESISFEEFNRLCNAIENPDNINITLEAAARIYSTFIAKQLLVDVKIERKSAIYVLENDGCVLKREVLGISKRFVESVLSGSNSFGRAPLLGNLRVQQVVSSPDGQILPTPKVARSSGSNKDKKRIQATLRACKVVRQEIEQDKHGFRVKGEYKTNRTHFQEAVQALLGSEKVHRDTLRNEWAKVAEDIKHSGRVPEQ